MSLTKNFKETIMARAKKDKKFCSLGCVFAVREHRTVFKILN